MDIDAATRKSLALATAIVGFTACHAALLTYRIPLVHSREGWFWNFRRTALPGLWLFLPAIAFAFLGALFLARRPSRRWGAIAVLILAGWITQVSFALMEGKGLDGLQDRMVSTGHAGFAREALRTDDYLEVARHYESLIAGHRLSGLCSTKPPGQLLVYLLTLRASAILDLVATGIGRFTRLTIFASLTWPLMTYLVCLVMPPMGVQLGCRRAGAWAAILFATAPNVTLVTLHLDQCLYPLLAACPALLFLHAARRRAGWSAALAGVTLYLGLFVTFSLLPLVLLIPLLALLVPSPGTAAGGLRARARVVAIFLAAFALTDIAFRLSLDYDIARRYAGVIEAHVAWKHVDWTPLTIRHYALLNVAEFALWSGLPLILLFAVRAIRALGRAGRRRLRAGDAFVLATAATLIAMAVLGRTAAESGRLWMFMLPFLCVPAGEEIAALGKERGRAVLWIAVLCQLALVLATKSFQDFF